MAKSGFTPDQIAYVAGLVGSYISEQRQRYVRRAFKISEHQKSRLETFFSRELLDDTRVVVLHKERMANPDFYAILANLGLKDLPDHSVMSAITFSDVVVSHEPFTDGLLFHEFVHVEQYRQLGIPRFAELYVKGFLFGGSYEAIPLEINAYTLEDRFRSDPKRGFPVAAEVEKFLRNTRLSGDFSI